MFLKKEEKKKDQNLRLNIPSNINSQFKEQIWKVLMNFDPEKNYDKFFRKFLNEQFQLHMRGVRRTRLSTMV